MAERMGQSGREYIREHFLLTRQTRDYMSLWYSMQSRKKGNLFELW
jgi:hypothetical protein